MKYGLRSLKHEVELRVRFVKVCWALAGAFFDELDSDFEKTPKKTFPQK